MPGRRTWLRLIGCLLLLLLLLGGLSYLSLNRLLQREQISQLDWQGLRLSTQGIRLNRLSLQHPSARLELHQLHLGWPAFSLAPPFWQHIQIARLHLNLPQPETATAPSEPLQWPIEQLNPALALLPRRLQIDALEVELPCAEQRCTLQGDLLLNHTQSTEQTHNLDLQLTLQHQQDQLRWQAQLEGDATTAQLQLALTINQQPQLTLRSSLQQSPAGPLWLGHLAGSELTQSQALHRWLSQWLSHPTQSLPALPTAGQLLADWQLQLTPGPISLAKLLDASGTISASAVLPEPWPIPAIGQLQGTLSVAAHALDGQWLADSLSADLTLKQIANDLIATLPEKLRPETVHLRIQPAEMPAIVAEQLAARAVPLAIELHSKGQGELSLTGTLLMANALPWGMQLLDGKLTAASPTVRLDGWDLGALSAQLQLDGYLDQQQLRLNLNKGSRLNLQNLNSGEWRAKQLDANSDNLQLTAQLQAGEVRDWQLQGPISLSAQLEQAQLRTQRWYWQGPLSASQQQVQLDGTLRNDAELQLKVQLQHSGAKGLSLQAKLTELFLRGGNPLQASFTGWPALLELNNGRLNATADLTLAPNQQMPKIKLNLTGKGLGGIYDRTALSGLDGSLLLHIDAQQLQLELEQLHLEQADPGITLGPVQLSGHYRAPLQTPSQGQLQLRQVDAALMGGNLKLKPGQWNLATEPLLFPIEVTGLELEQLFILYPTEGLAGSGTLDGRLPLQISSQGVTIEQGQLAARAPGGRLQFQSERIRALGRSNPAMQLVAQSLEDFRFTTLSSQVNYDRQGKLALAMRLEGQNPAIEQGRPINFNINLEEDIPTLLASLQLTDKVSDIIKQRVQQRMLERNAKKAPTEP